MPMPKPDLPSVLRSTAIILAVLMISASGSLIRLVAPGAEAAITHGPSDHDVQFTKGEEIK
jgi:hypothetical protein